MVYQPDTKKKMGGKIFVAVFLGILLLAGIGAVMTFVLMPKIPDLVGEQEEAAIEILKDMDYGKKEYSIEYEYDDRVEKGK